MTTTVLFGDLRGGRISDYIDADAAGYEVVVNDAGSITGVQVPRAEVARLGLRQAAPAARTFLAVDVDGRLQEAGPIWSRRRELDSGTVTLDAGGLWSLFDHRKVVPVLAAGQRAQNVTHTVAGTDLGGIARSLVALAMTHAGGNLPLILPTAQAGFRTESFPGWALHDVGEQLRQITKRETNAPDIRFTPRYTTDRLSIEWVMEAGTEADPLLTQAGEDWYLDASVPRSPVVGIVTDEDATQMGMRGWVTGAGSEQDIRIGVAEDLALIAAGWPLLEVEENRSTVLEQGTLDGHAENLVGRSARPVETWQVVVRSSVATEILPGHYARVVPDPADEWLGGEGEAFMRVASKRGNLGDNVTLNMYAVRGSV